LIAYLAGTQTNFTNNIMKKIIFAIAISIVALGCSNQPQQNNVTIENNTTSGFDVNKLGQFVKNSTDPATLEKAINNPSNQINNLDLDKDGNIDYLKVTEPGKNELAVVDDISNNESVTVATIKVNPVDNNQADLNIQGNPNYVGDNYYYHSHFSFTDFLLLSYLMRPHPYYVPMYHYGHYPSYYSRTRTVTHFRPTTSSSMRSYNRSSLSNPSRSQRSFGSRSNSSRMRSGGFGHSSGRSGFGHSRSGFGRRR
jgi:hypothetical protein